MTKFVVIAPTFYTEKADIRYQLGMQACREAVSNNIQLILVDASPIELDEVPKEVTILRQEKGKKGAAIRQGIAHAVEQLSNDEDFIGIQELEKVDMMRLWASIIEHKEGVLLVRRLEDSFQKFYPIEQFYSETFGNLYLDSLGNQLGLPPLDWTSGPLAFRGKFASHWLNCNGEIWDAQLVPVIDAFVAGATVASAAVDYKHPASMKEEEERSVEWNEKRLMQLNFLKDTVGEKMKGLIEQRRAGRQE